jgi:hypothetical protein
MTPMVSRVAYVLMFLLGFYFFVENIIFSFLIADFFVPAVEPLSIELQKIKIESSERLRYLATFKRNKACRSDIQRFVSRKDTSPVEVFQGRGGPINKDETETIDFRDSIIGIIRQGSRSVIKTVSIMDHPPLDPGKYGLQIYVISHCNLISRIDAYPEALFEVE